VAWWPAHYYSLIELDRCWIKIGANYKIEWFEKEIFFVIVLDIAALLLFDSLAIDDRVATFCYGTKKFSTFGLPFKHDVLFHFVSLVFYKIMICR